MSRSISTLIAKSFPKARFPTFYSTAIRLSISSSYLYPSSELQESVLRTLGVCVIDYRPFKNSDPPHLVDIWRSRTDMRALVQPMTVMMFDSLVLSKPYFDNEGLIIASENDKPIGFVHAGFGPNEAQTELDLNVGVTSMLLIHPDERQIEIANELLKRSEEYLIGKGAKTLHAGSIRPLTPFYLGLYGGSEMPGVLESDTLLQEVYRKENYEEVNRTIVFQRDLASMRPLVSRQLMQIRRETTISTTHDPILSTWWEACTLGPFDTIVFDLHPRQGGAVLATVKYWYMEQLSSTWGVNTLGLFALSVDTSLQRKGYATYLICESLRQLQMQGYAKIEVQTLQSNTAAISLLKKLQCEEIDQGVVFRKQV